jgi:hypothetical protein
VDVALIPADFSVDPSPTAVIASFHGSRSVDPAGGPAYVTKFFFAPRQPRQKVDATFE